MYCLYNIELLNSLIKLIVGSDKSKLDYFVFGFVLGNCNTSIIVNGIVELYL